MLSYGSIILIVRLLRRNMMFSAFSRFVPRYTPCRAQTIDIATNNAVNENVLLEEEVGY